MDDPSQMFFGDGWEQPQIGSMASGLENHSKARAAMSQQSMQTTSSNITKRRGNFIFNQDVDNYIGVKHIKNMMLVSMNDYDDLEQRYSLGVLHLYNKSSAVTEEDQQRIEALQRFLGAAITRVRIITGFLTVVIGLNMIMDEQGRDL